MRAFAVRTAIGASVALLLASVPALGQEVGRIRGSVTDVVTGQPIADAQVLVVGTSFGAPTNAAGAFTIDNVPAGTRTVRVRRLGYAQVDTAVSVAAGGETRLSLALRPAPSVLSQVVVTGTAEATTRGTLSNSITIINAEEINDRSTNQNVAELLQSKAPGVTVLPGSGAPGTSGEIRIRGASSISGYRPVVFVDGIRYNIEGLGNFNPTGGGIAGQLQSAQVTSALDFVNPDDIESIEVIKGPAAATLYGAEAAGGVIQIITKKGRRGQQKPQWTARYERGENEWGPDTPITYTFCNQAKVDSVSTATGQPIWPGCQGRVNQRMTDDPLARDPSALRVGTLDKLSLSVRGGGDRYSYYLAADNDRDEGFFFNSLYTRRSARANFAMTPTDRLDFTVSTAFAQTTTKLPFQDESAASILLSGARGKPGRVSPVGEGWATINPAVSNRYKNNTDADRVTIGGTFNYRPLAWFRHRLTAGIDYTSAEADLLLLPGEFDAPEGHHAQRVPRTTVYTLDYVGSIERPVTSTLMSTTSVGGQVVANETRRLDASGTGLGAPDVTVIGTATTTTGTNTFSEQNSVGVYLQQAIAWRDRVFFTGAVRADDNSSFGTDFDIIVYPKLGLSWILTQEPALDRVFTALRADEFKFRTAWGRAGRAPAPYSAVQTYTISKTTLGGTTSTSVPMLRTLAYGNPNLAPEKGEELEVGFDAGFFDGRVGADFTFYTKRTTNLLLSIPVAPSNGFPGSIIKNVGEVTNRGIELSLFGTPIQLDRFVWETRLNIATNRNRLESFGIPGRVNEIPGGQAYGQVQEHRVGYPLGGYWTQLPRRNASGGDSIANGRIVIDTAKVYIGPSTPTREIGLSNTLTLFRNFRLYALVDYKGGHFLYNRKEYDRCVSNENCELVTNPAARMGTDTALAARLPYFRTVNFFRPFIEESDFVKLRDISLSFMVPRAWVARAGAQGLTLTLSGKNLAQWTDYSGLDPEVNTYGGRNFVRVDAYASPAPRRWSLSGVLTY